MSKPEFKDGLMHVYAEPDTWCYPMHALGPLADLAEMAWDQRAKSKDGQRAFTERVAETCVRYIRRAADLRLQDVKGIDKLLDAMRKDAHLGGDYDRYKGKFKSQALFTMAKRTDSALELHEIQASVCETLGLVKPRFKPVANTHLNGQPIRFRSICPLGYFDPWMWEELELRWRVRDASWHTGAQVRGRERIAAFEALWTGDEREKAYEFLGAKLPPPWDES